MTIDLDMFGRGAFLDRDGTLIEEEPHRYLSDPADVKIMHGVVSALRHLRKLGFSLIVVTNQSGIDFGRITLAEYEAVTKRMVELFREHGIEFDSIIHCPHKYDAKCLCRKPNPGMIYSGASVHNIDLRNSIMVGDRDTDIEAGRRAGLNTFWIGPNTWSEFKPWIERILTPAE